MEIIRRETDYAVRCLVALATAGRALPCAELARQCQVPRSFAYKILKKMVRAGLLTSRDGRAGGFALRKDPADISLLMVAKVTQGPLTVRKCVLSARACPRAGGCSLSCQWKRLQGQVVEFLQTHTLAGLLE